MPEIQVTFSFAMIGSLLQARPSILSFCANIIKTYQLSLGLGLWLTMQNLKQQILIFLEIYIFHNYLLVTNKFQQKTE